MTPARTWQTCAVCGDRFSCTQPLAGCDAHGGPALTITGRPSLVDWRRRLLRRGTAT